MVKIVDGRYSHFLTKIFEMTKSCALSWKYLDSNKTLCEGMRWSTSYSGIGAFLVNNDIHFDFNIDSSFYCEEGNTCIVLLVHGTQPADVYIGPNTFKNVVQLSAEIYGDIITRLLNLVQSQFPDGEAFIDDFLKG